MVQPHRLDLSSDDRARLEAAFAAELLDAVGLYLDPPARKVVVHVILDDHRTRKHPKVLAWLGRHPRFVCHFTPTSGPWLNAVVTFFSRLTRRRLRRDSFASLVELQTAIRRFVDATDGDPEPFVWTATPAASSMRVCRAQQASASVH